VENKRRVQPNGNASGPAGQCRVGWSRACRCGASREGARRPSQERASTAPHPSRCANGGSQKSRIGRQGNLAGSSGVDRPAPASATRVRRVAKFEEAAAGRRAPCRFEGKYLASLISPPSTEGGSVKSSAWMRTAQLAGTNGYSTRTPWTQGLRSTSITGALPAPRTHSRRRVRSG
jgi:hypothetical protein